MSNYESGIDAIIEQFEQLPSIGHKKAEQLTFHILEQMSEDEVSKFCETILTGKKSIKLCPICQNLTDKTPCKICASPRRNTHTICVVERPEDVNIIESTNEFHGLYHVLHGALSPMDNIGPDDIKIKELLERVGDSNIEEIIIATNPTINGTATASYIGKLLAPFDIKVTRIAHGIPYGTDLSYIDKTTISVALNSRKEI